MKKCFPWKFNLEYGGTFTKLCFKSKYAPNIYKSTHPCACLSSSPLLWRLINFRLFCSDDCRSWPRDRKINNHGCWGKHAHIFDNDYWGICLFHVVWTIFWGAIILMWYTQNIFLLAFDIFFINWTVRMSDNLPEIIQILGQAHIICITVQKTESSAVKYFAICS